MNNIFTPNEIAYDKSLLYETDKLLEDSKKIKHLKKMYDYLLFLKNNEIEETELVKILYEPDNE